ncbi:MAG: Sir2 family NAD-dependent protein deacetylase [Candidatus Dormiibacterota bacterium]
MEPDPVTATFRTPGLGQALPWLRHARRILVFTGAGISTESGIPDFRGPNGIWKTTDPQRYTIESYVRDRDVRVERWRARLESRYSEAAPNAAHLAVTRLQRAGLVPVVVTQNIDGLHQKAGTVNVIELHGTTSEAVCLQCERRLPIGVALDRVREGDEDPHCELCGGLLKTATISFGQQLVAADMDRAREEARLADVCITVGSTLSVWPAAAVPVETVREGGRLVIVNEGATDLDGMATVLLSGRAGTVLTELANALLGDGDSG